MCLAYQSGNSSGVTFKSQYEIPTNEKGYTKSSLDLGKKVHNDLQYPKNNECDITGRFFNETNKGIYQLDTMNVEELVMSLEKNILNIIVPVINEGISKYFELFPNAICRATLNLKKYLGIN